MRYSLYRTTDSTVMGIRTRGVAVSSTNTYYSEAWSGQNSDGAAAHFEWTGTPTGTLTLWRSNKEAPDPASDADWVQDSTFTPTNPAGSAGKFMDEMGNAKARWWRAKYVNASGSGVLFLDVTVPRIRS